MTTELFIIFIHICSLSRTLHQQLHSWTRTMCSVSASSTQYLHQCTSHIQTNVLRASSVPVYLALFRHVHVHFKTESLPASKHQVNRLLARSEEERLAFEELDREQPGISGVFWRCKWERQTAPKCNKENIGKPRKAMQPKGVYDPRSVSFGRLQLCMQPRYMS